MHFVVCLKQVPDTNEVKIDPETNNLIREGVPAIINPYDLNALEAALQLKEQYGGRVTVLSMGPPMAQDALKKAVSLGADEAVLLSDRAFAGADTLATSYLLTKAIERLDKENKVTLVLCGKQAIDGDTAQVGPGIAARLNYPQLTYILTIKELDEDKNKIVVERKMGSKKECLETKLPALVTILEDVNEIRYASLDNMIKAARYQCSVWGQAELQADTEKIGLKGSPTIVRDIFSPPQKERKGGEIIPDGENNPEEAVKNLVEKLASSDIISIK